MKILRTKLKLKKFSIPSPRKIVNDIRLWRLRIALERIKKKETLKKQGGRFRFPKFIKARGRGPRIIFGFKTRFILVLIVGVMMIGTIWLFWGIPLPTQLADENFPVSTKIFDRNGKLIYEIFGSQRRTPIKLDELPKHVKDATIAIEDKDFYTHKGFSPTGIARALKKTFFEGKTQGGSTITQQLVKNSLLSHERTLKRKAQEFALAVAVETIYSKDTILEMYLNQIPYGGTAYGIEAAAETYFGKSARELSLAEAAYLAGLPVAPSRYSPFGAHPELAKGRQEQVLEAMLKENMITTEEKDKAVQEEIKLKEFQNLKAPHFSLWIKEQLAQTYGERVVEQGGLRVTTTLDLELQEYAQEVVASEVGRLTKQKVGNGAAIVTRPTSGEILAMVGSKDYYAEDEDGNVNVVFRERQPGSSIKPLNYALGIRDKKITAATPLADVPTCFGVAGQPVYCPVNYDGSYHGGQHVRYSLGNSYNVPAVRTLALNGIENFIEFAESMGITTFSDPSRYGLSLTLGGGEVRPFDMATAFGVFANGGIKQEPIGILKVEDWKGKVLEEVKVEDIELGGARVLDPEVTFIISHILSDNGARTAAFGPSSLLNVTGHPEVSVKTGTTNDRRDNWTIGYTAHMVAVAWVGNNDNTPMSGAVSGVSGASPIWNKIIKKALDKAEEGLYNANDEGHAALKQPEGIVGKNVCADTGNAANEIDPNLPPEQQQSGCSATRFEFFLKDAVGASIGAGHTAVQIDKTTGALANTTKPPDKGGTPAENIETQDKPFILDPLGTLICLDCPIPTWPTTIGYPLKR